MSIQHSDFPIQALRLCAWAGLLVGGCAPAGTATSQTPLPPAAAEASWIQSEAPAESAPGKEPATLLTDSELADGWISLFEGDSLFGWKATSKADWAVRDGAITVGQGEPGLLCTTTEFGDYVLQVDFRCEPGTNSGIFLHTTLSPRDPAKDCYELNVAGSENPYPTGSLVQRQAVRDTAERRDWQTYEVRVDGGRVTVWLDGRQLYEYQDPHPLRRGHIGLQFNAGPIAFRNVKLRPLGLTSLLSGKSLTGWKQYPQMATKFSIREDGSLHVQGGRGQLETETSYADFALQFECLTHVPDVNSGVFFRCIPGQEMMGYEAQIHNGFKPGDRSRPTDCGTGGIFRRQAARRVMSDDGQWFRETLIAHGLHVAVWVNGYQVTDWVDQRPPDENPRKGLRLEPGTIMIQGHDASTDLSFRNLRAAELAKRQE